MCESSLTFLSSHFFNLTGNSSSGKSCGIDYCPTTSSTTTTIDKNINHDLKNTKTLFSIFAGTAACGIIFAVIFLSSDLKDDGDDSNDNYFGDNNSDNFESINKDDSRFIKKDESLRYNNSKSIDSSLSKDLGIISKLKEIFVLIRDPNLLELVPLMMGVGAIHSFTYGDLTKVNYPLSL